MRINHNIAALNTYNKLSANTAATAKSLEKLSSGLKINKAGDNAAGLAISEKMRGQIRGLDQASTNANDAISLINTAEGALSETHSILQRMRELAVQSSNDTNVTIDREEIQKEMNQLTSEINRIGNTTEFNTQKLLDGGGSSVTGQTVDTTKAGGAAGKISNVDTVTTSNSGKSLATFKAGDYTISIQGNDTTTNLGGKTITFSDTAAAAGSETIGVSGDDVTINVHANSTLAQIQAALDISTAFGSGGVTLSMTQTSTGTVQSSAALSTFTGATAADWETATTTPAGFTSASSSATSRGTYSIDVSQSFVKSGDTFKLKLANGNSPDGWSEITLTATQAGTNQSTAALAGTFNIGADVANRTTAEQQAAAIVAALKTDGGTAWDLGGTNSITDVYDISASGSSVIFTEKSALGPQASIKDGAFTLTNAVAGESTYDHVGEEMVDVGGSFIIDDVEIKVVDGTGETDTADIAAGTAILKTSTQGASNLTQIDLLSEAINRNVELNNKYSASDDNAGLLTLTQKTGYESSTAPVLEVSNKAGQTFEANFQIGANTAQSMTIEIADMRSAALKISGTAKGGEVTAEDNITKASYVTTDANVTDGTTKTETEYSLDVSTHQKATAAISVINDAIQTVSAERSKLGSYQNRLEHTINNLGTSSENLTTAESRIRDVDMAKEMMEFTKNNILSQAAQSMLAQANQQPQGVLQLLG